MAVNAEGAHVQGVTVADDSRGVAERLRRDGYSVVSVTRRQWPPTNIHMETVKRRDIIDFTYKIVPLLTNNLTLNRTIDILRNEVKKRRIRNALVAIKDDINGGETLSNAMAKRPDVFDAAYVCAVRAGEEGGELPQSLSMMGKYLEWLDDIIKRMWGIVIYPLLVLTALVALNFVLAFFAIPTFMDLYKRLGHKIEVPLATKIVFAYSGFMRDYWPVILAFACLLWIVFYMRKFFPGLRFFLHYMILRIPYWGGIVRRMQSLQFCRFFQMLYEHGVDVKRSLAESRGVLTNVVMKDAVNRVCRRLDEGRLLSEAFNEAGEFPPLVAEQIHVGEESGDIGGALGYIVRYYDSELDYSITRFETFLRPALVFVLAGVMLLLALAFYLPLFEIANLIQAR